MGNGQKVSAIESGGGYRCDGNSHYVSLSVCVCARAYVCMHVCVYVLILTLSLFLSYLILSMTYRLS